MNLKIDYSNISNSNLVSHISNIVTNLNIDSGIKSQVLNSVLSYKNITSNQRGELEKALIVFDIYKNYQNEEFFKGAHIIVKDNGNLYDQLSKVEFTANRTSSHHKNNKADDDISFQAGEIFRELLIGKTSNGETWFQLEAHSTKGVVNTLNHMFDYFQYKYHHKNISQYGMSEHTESNPIILDYSDNSFNIAVMGDS